MKKEKRKGAYRRLTQEEFIERAKANQKVELDYSKVVYTTQHEKYEVTCLKHNITYFQKGQALILGRSGCRLCKREEKSERLSHSLADFIKTYSDRYPNHKFDFSKAVYVNSTTNMTVVCELGHNFSIRPSNLMSGKGCPKCFNVANGHYEEICNESYIEKFRKVHGDRYDYSLYEHNGSKENSKFICKRHGLFLQTTGNHLAGKGCGSCANEMRSKNQRFTKDRFIELATDIHGNTYDYSKVEYVNSQTKVVIGCSVHGYFEQVPNSHLQGCGCPSCKRAGFSPNNPATFYIMKVSDSVIKFGITSDVNRRLYHIQRKTDLKIELLYSTEFNKGSSARALENEIKGLVETSVVCASLLPDGHTETTYISNYDKMLSLIETYKDQLS